MENQLPRSDCDDLPPDECDSEQVAAVQNGDLVRFDVSVSVDGYLTVLNLSSDGSLVILFPNAQTNDHHIRSGQPQRLTVEITPPSGTDRTAFIWTRQSEQLTSEQWRERIEHAPNGLVTRNMAFLLHEPIVQPTSEMTVRVIRVVHRSSASVEQPVLRSYRDMASIEDTVTPWAQATDLDSPDGLKSAPTGRVSCAVIPPSHISTRAAEPLWIVVQPENLSEKSAHVAGGGVDNKSIPSGENLPFLLPHGEKLSFHVSAPGLEIEPRVKEVVWKGQRESLCFAVNSEVDTMGPVRGKVIVYRQGHPIPIARLRLRLGAEVAGKKEDICHERRTIIDVRRFTRLYISSVTSDEREVSKRLAALQGLKVDYPSEIMECGPAERWEKGLYRQIDGCDLFVIFWSNAATRSPWLLEELRYAFRRQTQNPHSLPEIVLALLPGSSVLKVPPGSSVASKLGLKYWLSIRSPSVGPSKRRSQTNSCLTYRTYTRHDGKISATSGRLWSVAWADGGWSDRCHVIAF